MFDPIGVLTARMETPDGFYPHRVYESEVWGNFTDPDAHPSVRAYALFRNGE